MAVHAAIADGSFGRRTRRRHTRNFSHRFRRQGHIGRRPGVRLVLGISVAVVLALALRSTLIAWRHNDPAPHHGSETVPPATSQVIGMASPVTAARPTVPATVFRVQLASFLDPRNAARMIVGLRDAGLPVETRVIEGQHVRYRVLATLENGENAEALLSRLRRLGFPGEVTNGTAAVTAFVSIEDADEIAGRLEDHGIAVHVERKSRAVSYHVVRVGAYRTSEAAEGAKAELAERGLDGIVGREQETAADVRVNGRKARPAG